MQGTICWQAKPCRRLSGTSRQIDVAESATFPFNANLNGTELFGDVRTLIVHCKPNRFVI